MEAHPQESTSDDLIQRRSYWRWRKLDFFPEFSFQSESEKPMRRCLTWWDLLWLSYGSVVGSAVFVLTGQEARIGAVVLSYAISALLSVLCYAEFGVQIPLAGGSFSYLRVELRDFIVFIAAGNDSDYFRIRIDSFAKGFDLLDPVAVAVAVLLVANGIAMSGTKRTSWLNLITPIVIVCVIVLIVVVGFTHSKSSNLVPFFLYGAKGVVQSAAVVYWSYTGFDMVATMAEETEKTSEKYTNWFGWFDVYDHRGSLFDGFGVDYDGEIH